LFCPFVLILVLILQFFILRTKFARKEKAKGVEPRRIEKRVKQAGKREADQGKRAV
jgi:hypothetical protein